MNIFISDEYNKRNSAYVKRICDQRIMFFVNQHLFIHVTIRSDSDLRGDDTELWTYESAKSSTIIIENPIIKQNAERVLFTSFWDSGITFAMTTSIMAPAAKLSA